MIAEKAHSGQRRWVPAHVGQLIAIDQCRLLAQQLGFRSPGSARKKLIGVTGLSRGVGVTSVVKSFAAAIALGSTRRVLMIDANVADPQLSAMPGVGNENSREIEGAAQRPLHHEAGWIPTSIENLYLAPIGTFTSQANKFERWILDSSDAFEAVIIDLPKLPDCLDVLSLSSLDGIVLTVEAGGVTRTELQQARRMLERIRVPIVGIVFNKQESFWRKLLPRWMRRSC